MASKKPIFSGILSVEKHRDDFAISYPEKVEKLIVADIAPKAYPPHHQGIIKSVSIGKFR